MTLSFPAQSQRQVGKRGSTAEPKESKPFCRWSVAFDPYDLAPRLRQEDKQELKALFGESVVPLDRLLIAYACSKPSSITVCNRDQRPIAMFGVVPVAEDTGSVWMLGSDEILHEAKRPFLRECRSWIDRLNKVCPVLFNIVDTRNLVHQRWIKWCGFTIDTDNPLQAGPDGLTFYQFHRSANKGV